MTQSQALTQALILALTAPSAAKAQMALDCLRSTLCTGTMAIENWCELQDEVKP
jgi:hypothetical protein